MGIAGQPLKLDGSKSRDPEGKPLACVWTFGDGTAPAAGAVVEHTYGSMGRYTATIACQDEKGLSASASAEVRIDAVPLPGPILYTDGFDGDGAPSGWWRKTSIQGQLGGAAGFDPQIAVVKEAGKLTISPRLNAVGSHYNGVVSVTEYDLLNCEISAEVIQVASGEKTNTNLALCKDPTNYLLMTQEAGKLYFQVTTNKTKDLTWAVYSLSGHRFWKIGITKGKTSGTGLAVFAISGDGHNWAVLRLVDFGFSPEKLFIELSAGTWGPVATPGKAIFDNFRFKRL